MQASKRLAAVALEQRWYLVPSKSTLSFFLLLWFSRVVPGTLVTGTREVVQEEEAYTLPVPSLRSKCPLRGTVSTVFTEQKDIYII